MSRSLATRLLSRTKTVAGLLRHFASTGKWFFLPLLLVLLVSAILLLATTGLSYVAPFVYTLF